ncbi:MAG: CopD family protein [Myxococcota bacterium]
MASLYPTLKALHIVAIVAWFAGLFYIVRLFVYLAEARDRSPADRAVLEPQLRLMARRLWFGITWPAAIAAVAFGSSMVPLFWPPPVWLQVKLALVAGLVGYHLQCHRIHRALQQGEPTWSSRSFRIWNEVATLFLVGIVFVVVLKDAMSLVWGTVGVVVFGAVLMAGITGYRRIRERATP